MSATPVLEYLKQHGQRLDAEIAAGTGLHIDAVRAAIEELSARGEVSKCSVTRFNEGEPFTGVLCRIAGSVPVGTPGRKPGVKP